MIWREGLARTRVAKFSERARRGIKADPDGFLFSSISAKLVLKSSNTQGFPSGVDGTVGKGEAIESVGPGPQ